MGEDEEIVVEDMENWKGSGEKTFNSQALVMNALQKCLDAGSVEMIEGFFDNKIDRQGNVVRVYHPDTRKAFIESVKTLIMFVHRDFKDHQDYKEKVEKLIKKVNERKIFWLGEEWRWWSSLNNLEKQNMVKQGRTVNRGAFNRNNEFDNFYNAEELDLYREICSLINDFIKDKMYDYEAETFSG